MTTNTNETTANANSIEKLERRLRENELESLGLSEDYAGLMREHRRLMEQEKATRNINALPKLFDEIKQLHRKMIANVAARTQLARTMAVIRTELGISV